MLVSNLMIPMLVAPFEFDCCSIGEGAGGPLRFLNPEDEDEDEDEENRLTATIVCAALLRTHARAVAGQHLGTAVRVPDWLGIQKYERCQG